MTRTGPAGYAVRVEGHLDDQRVATLGGWTLERNPDGTTTLTASSGDQAHLHGLLAGLRDLGVVLLTVSALPEA